MIDIERDNIEKNATLMISYLYLKLKNKIQLLFKFKILKGVLVLLELIEKYENLFLRNGDHLKLIL